MSESEDLNEESRERDWLSYSLGRAAIQDEENFQGFSNMAKRTIRYKKPEWKEWVYVYLEENEVENYVKSLENQGYRVEK